MTPATTRRLFYALWPDDALRDRLIAVQKNYVTGRLTSRSNLHMTLAFLGQQPEEVVPSLCNALQRLPPGNEIALSLDRLGYFRKPRIAWAGMSAVPASLLYLRDELMLQIAACGIAMPDSSTFIPHVTLARDSVPPLTDDMVSAIAWRTTSVVLVESVARKGGVEYVVIAAQ